MSLNEQTPPPHDGPVVTPVTLPDPPGPDSRPPQEAPAAVPDDAVEQAVSGHVVLLVMHGMPAGGTTPDCVSDWEGHGLLGRVLVAPPPAARSGSGASARMTLSAAQASPAGLVVRTGRDGSPGLLADWLARTDRDCPVSSLSVASVRLCPLSRAAAEAEALLLEALRSPLSSSGVSMTSFTVGPARPDAGWSQWSFGTAWDRHYLCSAPAPDCVPHESRTVAVALSLAGGWSFSSGPQPAGTDAGRDALFSAASGTVRLVDAAVRAAVVPGVRAEAARWSVPARPPWPLPVPQAAAEVHPAGSQPVPESFVDAVSEAMAVDDPAPAAADPSRRSSVLSHVPLPAAVRRALRLPPPAAAPGAALLSGRASNGLSVSDPGFWRLFRAVMFGLCDGGPMPAPLAPPSALANGSEARLVWTDPSPVCRPPGIAGTAPPPVSDDDASAEPFGLRLYRRLSAAADLAERMSAGDRHPADDDVRLPAWQGRSGRSARMRRWCRACGAVVAASVLVYAESRLGVLGSLLQWAGMEPVAPLRDSAADTVAVAVAVLTTVAVLSVLAWGHGSDARMRAERQAYLDATAQRSAALRRRAVRLRSLESQFLDHEAAVAAVLHEPVGLPSSVPLMPDGTSPCSVMSPDGSLLRVWEASLDGSVAEASFERRWEERSSGHAEGWMSALFREASQLWAQDYGRTVLGRWAAPDEDFSPTGSMTHQDRATSEPVASPRQHFASDLPRVLAQLRDRDMLRLCDPATPGAAPVSEVVGMMQPRRLLTPHLSGPSGGWLSPGLSRCGAPDWGRVTAPHVTVPEFSPQSRGPELAAVGDALLAGSVAVTISAPLSPDSLDAWRPVPDSEHSPAPSVV